MKLKGRRIGLGITGGIAAYKAAELTRLIIKEGGEVRVAMTAAATEFVTPLTFEALSGRPVLTALWETTPTHRMAHIEFSRESELLLVAPASANYLAKTAQGLADDLLSTLTLARNCPLFVAPAMNREMWHQRSTQRNIATLRQDEVHILGPATGEQACGEIGEGRMLEPHEIVEALITHFTPKVLSGKKVLLTAGPTFEAIDPVRGITNLSSGKMGFAIACAARDAGAEVTLVTGPVSLARPSGIRYISVESALQMHSAVMAHAPSQDVFIGVAAVADYRPAEPADQKIKKEKSAPPVIHLLENPDILAEVAALPKGPYCVGFAAETQGLAEYAEKKRQRKNIPMIVGNLIQDGFGQDHNIVTIFDDTGSIALPTSSKSEIASHLVRCIAKKLEQKDETAPTP